MTKTGQQISDNLTVKDIKKAMIDQDLSITQIAQIIGKSRSAVSFAINHPTVVPQVRRTVLKTLKLAHA
jgi:ABC-type molybdate transport system permease subunit